MKEIVKNAGKVDEYDINSACTRVLVGYRIYPQTREELERRGTEYDKQKRSARVKKSDYEKRDLFVVMDERNVRDLTKIFGKDDKNKIRKLLDFTQKGGEIADPWRTRKFDVAYDEILCGCRALFEKLEQNVPRETV